MAEPPSNHPPKDDSDSDTDSDSDEDRYDEFFQSIRSDTGLEIGVKVTWPVDASTAVGAGAGAASAPTTISMELSTCLEPKEIAPMFHGTQWAGTRVWRAAVVALQYLETGGSGNTIVKIDSDTTILELGCGLGVPGMLLNRIFDCNVVVTDMESLVPQLRLNLESNGLTTTAANGNTNSSKIQAAPLDWSVEGLQELQEVTQIKRFDIVLNCDCIYEPLYGESWKMLLKVQEALLKEHPETIMLTSVERRKFDGVELYLQGLNESDAVSKVEQVSIDFDYPQEVELYRIHGVVVPA